MHWMKPNQLVLSQKGNTGDSGDLEAAQCPLHYEVALSLAARLLSF